MSSSLTPAQYRAVWDALESMAGVSPAERRRELRHRFASDPGCLREALALLEADEELGTGHKEPASSPRRADDTIEGSTLRVGPQPPAAVTPVIQPAAAGDRRRARSTARLPLVVALVMALAAVALLWWNRRTDEATARLASARLGSVVAMARAASGTTTGVPTGFATIEALHRSAGDDLTLLLATADAYGRLSATMQGSRDGPPWSIVAAQNAVNLLVYVDGRGATAPVVLERLADAQLLLAEQLQRHGDAPAAARALGAAEQTIERLTAEGRSDRQARAAAQRRRLPQR